MYLTYLYFEPSLLWRDSMFNEFDIDGGETQESYMGTQQVVPLFEKEVVRIITFLLCLYMLIFCESAMKI